jgi:hypothetical protein
MTLFSYFDDRLKLMRRSHLTLDVAGAIAGAENPMKYDSVDADISIFWVRNIQCCGSGSGIRCFFYPWIQDPGWEKYPEPRSGLNILDHFSESFETVFGLQIL